MPPLPAKSLSLVALALLVAQPIAADEPRSRPAAAAPRNFEPAAHAQPIDGFGDRAAAGQRTPPAAKPLGGRERTPITRHGAQPEVDREHGTSPTRSRSGPSSIVAVLGSLGIVLGLFFAVTWILRRGLPRGAAPLPAEVVENLGRTPLGARQFAHLLRLGNKLVLVSVTPNGAETLAELTDPIEVDRLAGLCRQHAPHSATASFRQVFHQFGRDRSARGFLESSSFESPPGDDQQPQDSDVGREEFHA